MHDGGTQFTLKISNISNSATLATPLAPGVLVVHSANQKPIYEANTAASSGLEKLAEDGDNAMISSNLSSKSGYVSPFAPGAFSIGNTNNIFTTGAPASASLEALAEDGNASGYAAASVFNTPVGASSPGPLLPSKSYSFTFTANANDKLSLATMLVQSNDWFLGLDNVNLFNGSTPISGDITSQVALYDAGTEVDEYAGAGANQPLRQAAANTGMAENGNVMEESSPSANVPAVQDMVKVTVQLN